MKHIRIIKIEERTRRGRHILYRLDGDASEYAGDHTRLRYRYIWNKDRCAFIEGTRLLERQWNKMVSSQSVAIREFDRDTEMRNRHYPAMVVF